MNAQQYFEAMVVPTYKEFERDRSDRRRALLVSLVLFHLLDYVNADGNGKKGDLGNLQKTTRERCASFKGIEALVNATKHVEMRVNHFSLDRIEEHTKGTILDQWKTEQNATREFKTMRHMLWFELENKKHSVDVDLFATLRHLAREHGLIGINCTERVIA